MMDYSELTTIFVNSSRTLEVLVFDLFDVFYVLENFIFQE